MTPLRPDAKAFEGATRLSIRRGGHAYDVRVSDQGGVTIGGLDGPVTAVEVAPGEWHVRIGDRDVAVWTSFDADRVWAFVEGETYSFEAARLAGDRRTRPVSKPGDLSAPMPATVVRVLTRVGAAVRAGETLLVLEAMKMELPLKAPCDGRVVALNCREGDQVKPGYELIAIE
jgi:biotin carboxyl carrier protein